MMVITKLSLLFFLVGMSSSAHIGNEYHNPDENGDIPNNNFYEGDIKLSMNPGTRVARLNGKWPNRIMYYTYDSTIAGTDGQTVIEEAIAEWESKTCIKFIPRENQASYVKFTAEDNGCYSFVGRTGGEQPINLQPPSNRGSCWFKGIAAHEIAHALGFFHEQSRPDRDQYITVLTENIRAGLEHNFDPKNEDSVSTHGTEYDFGSLMHYGRFAFTNNGQPTIQAKIPGVAFGQRERISELDAEEMNIAYNCRKITEKPVNPGATPRPSPAPETCRDTFPTKKCAKIFAKDPNRCTTKKKVNKRCRKTCNLCSTD